MNERKVIRKCREHDLGAFKMIYDRYEQPLLRTAFRLLGQRQDAEDAVQTTFLRLFHGIQDFRRDSKFSTYLFRILINTCLDTLEKRKREGARALQAANLSCNPKRELQIHLEEAIAALPERMRACFVLFAVEGARQDEIAEILDLSLGGVKSNIYQAKVRLRAVLSDSPAKERS